MTIRSQIEHLPKLTTGYELRNIWNMYELALFFKALLQNQKRAFLFKNWVIKQRFTAVFFVATDGSKVSEPFVTWKRKSPTCFENIQNKTRPSIVHYFSNSKSWMQAEVVENVLGLLDRKVRLEGRKSIVFLDNALFHPEPLQSNLTNLKLIFLPKYTMKPLDAGIN